MYDKHTVTPMETSGVCIYEKEFCLRRDRKNNKPIDSNDIPGETADRAAMRSISIITL